MSAQLFFGLNKPLKTSPVFIILLKTGRLCQKFIILPDNLFFIYSYFAAAKISQISIPPGQKLLHLPHFKHISRYLFIVCENFKSPFITPPSMRNLPLLATQSFGFILNSGHTLSQRPHFEHLFISGL